MAWSAGALADACAGPLRDVPAEDVEGGPVVAVEVIRSARREVRYLPSTSPNSTHCLPSNFIITTAEIGA